MNRGRPPKPAKSMDELRTSARKVLARVEERRPQGHDRVEHLRVTANQMRQLLAEFDRKVRAETRRLEMYGPPAQGVCREARP